MAITAITARGSYGAATNIGSSGTFATSAFTPSAEALLLAWVTTQGGPGVASNGIASISGHGTWAQLPSDIGDLPYIASNDRQGEWWYTFSGASPSSTAVTVTNTTQTKIRATLSVFEVVGDNIDSASDIYDIVRQIEQNSDTSGSTSGSVTLASFTGSGYAVVCGVEAGRYQEDTVWDSPMVEIHDLATGTEAARGSTAGYIGEDTSPGFSWGANNRTWRAIALELNDPAGGGSPQNVTMTGAITTAPSVVAPTLVAGNANVTIAAAIATAPSVVAPAVVAGAAQVTIGAAISVGPFVVAPTLSQVSQVVIGAALAVGPSVVAPTVVAGAVSVVVGAAITVTPSVVAPTLSLSGAPQSAVIGAAISTGPSVVAPTVSAAASVVIGAAISTTPSIVAPTVAASSTVAISAAISAGPTVVAPTLTAGLVVVLTAAIAVGPTVIAPAVTGPQAVALAAAISVAIQVVAPVLINLLDFVNLGGGTTQTSQGAGTTRRNLEGSGTSTTGAGGTTSRTI